jgi:DNA-binding transcriptional regulator YiaG
MKKSLPTMKPEELRSIRLALGKSQTEMAEALGVGLRTMQHWELGERSISGPAVLLARCLSAKEKSKN